MVAPGKSGTCLLTLRVTADTIPTVGPKTCGYLPMPDWHPDTLWEHSWLKYLSGKALGPDTPEPDQAHFKLHLNQILLGLLQCPRTNVLVCPCHSASHAGKAPLAQSPSTSLCFGKVYSAPPWWPAEFFWPARTMSSRPHFQRTNTPTPREQKAHPGEL